jgi:predicted amidohydrolase
MKLFCGQLNIVWEDKPANYEAVRRLIDSAPPPSGSLVVLPEMFATGFTMNLDCSPEDQAGPTETFLRELAIERGLFLMGGVVGRGADGRARNQAVVFSPQGQLLTRYSKIHPFTLGGETACYAAGTEVVTFQWQGCVVAPFICYDLRFPEVFRAGVQRGAQLFTVIANWPVKRERHWVTLLQARAIENQAYVIGVNRCGTDPKFTYSGRSLIVDPHGLVIVQIGDREGLVGADVDLGALEAWRKDFPALGDMHWSPQKG